MKKLLSITLAAALTLGSMSTVAFAAETEADILPGNGQKIGVSMPTKDLQRWNQDGDNMKAQLEAAGYEVDLQYASNDVQTQLSQVQNMINTGSEVLVIAAIEGSSLGEALASAKENGIPVFAYDRLLMDSDAVSYYATFDNYMVGTVQGQYISELIRFGFEQEDGNLAGSVDARVRAQEGYEQIRAIIKSFQRCIIGPIMSDRIVLVVPHEDETITYEERIDAIDRMRSILDRLSGKMQMKFRAGIGKIYRYADLRMSYQEAAGALRTSGARVVHTDDITSHGVYEDNYPVEVERDSFTALARGDVAETRERSTELFDWMVSKDPEDLNSMRLKVLELVLRAEYDAFHTGSVNYAYDDRKEYLTQINSLMDPDQIRDWFLDRMTAISSVIRDQNEEQSETTVSKACKYIQENFRRDISLDDVSKEVNVSPYYFSKLFKEEVGENFIEYLTRLRIECSKELLRRAALTIREAGLQSGYSDPNYFSRIFKKQTGMTPREYREQNM